MIENEDPNETGVGQIVEVVNARTGELTTETRQTPEDLLLAARDAAQALERVIKLNEKPPLMFNGKRYLEYHHWQTIGKFYHNAVRTFDAQPVDIGGVVGFKARAEVFDEKTGCVVGGAEAYCLRDEPNWKTKPTFQLASMAQTRAASKALGNKFRYVAVVAGYEGTPAEEMTAETVSGQKQVTMPKEKPVYGATAMDRASRIDTLAVAHANYAPIVAPAAKAAMNMQAPIAKANSPFPEVAKYATPPVPTPAVRAPLSDRPAPEGMKDDYSDEKPVSKLFTMLHTKSREKSIPDEVMKKAIGQMFRKTSSRELSDSQLVQLIKFVEGWTPGDL